MQDTGRQISWSNFRKLPQSKFVVFLPAKNPIKIWIASCYLQRINQSLNLKKRRWLALQFCKCGANNRKFQIVILIEVQLSLIVMSCDSSGRNPWSSSEYISGILTLSLKLLQILCLLLRQKFVSLPLNCWKAAQLFLEVPRQNRDGILRSGSHGCQQLRRVMLKLKSYCSVQWS